MPIDTTAAAPGQHAELISAPAMAMRAVFSTK